MGNTNNPTSEKDMIDAAMALFNATYWSRNKESILNKKGCRRY